MTRPPAGPVTSPHDPAPVLAVNGEKDLQVKAKDNLEAIESALKKGGNKAFKCTEFKGLNHLFQTCKTGQIGEYGQIEETVAPEVLKAVTEWITERKLAPGTAGVSRPGYHHPAG